MKKKVKKFTLDLPNKTKFKDYKMDDLIFTELKFQNYLVSGNISDQKQNNLHFRTNYSENFRGQDAPKPFQVCRSHIDCQEHSVNCAETMKNVNKKGKYDEIFSSSISSDTAIMLEQILRNRENLLG